MQHETLKASEILHGIAAGNGNCSDGIGGSSSFGQQLYSLSSFSWWACLLLAMFCVLLSAVASGANMGIMSLSVLELRLLSEVGRTDNNGDEEDAARDGELIASARCARRVLPLVRQKHLVLVTLLLTTALADEVLPLCINAIAPTWVAVVVSVIFMLLFTEILPTAVFTDTRVNLKLTSSLTPFVWFLIFVEGMITWPMAVLLKCCIDRRYGADRDAADHQLNNNNNNSSNRKVVTGASCVMGGQDANNSSGVGVGDKSSSADPVGSLLRLAKFKALLRLLYKLAPEVAKMPSSTTPNVTNTSLTRHGGVLSTPPMGPMSSSSSFLPSQLLATKGQLVMAERVMDLPMLRLRDVLSDVSDHKLHDRFLDEQDAESMLCYLCCWCIDKGPWCVYGSLLVRIRPMVHVLQQQQRQQGGSGGVHAANGRELLEQVASNEAAVVAPLLLDESLTLLEAYSVMQKAAASPQQQTRDWLDPVACVVLVLGSAGGGGGVVGVCDVRDALRRSIVPDSCCAKSPLADKVLRRASASASKKHVPSSPAGRGDDGVGDGDDGEGRGVVDSDDDDMADVGHLMLQPREANAVPWSQRYAHTRF